MIKNVFYYHKEINYDILHFDEEQATEAMVFLLGKSGGSMNYMKAIKMLYLADRDSLSMGHNSITTDSYKSLLRGPVTSIYLIVLDGMLVKNGTNI